MTPIQFLEALMELMGVLPEQAGDVDQCLNQLQRIAQQMDMDAKYLILIVDDAHEMSAEVLQVLQDISARSENIRSILFGESQLENMLNSTMSEESFDKLARFDLLEFGSEEVNDYIGFKLETAGYKGALPLSGAVIGGLVNESNGIPGTVNALVSDALETPTKCKKRKKRARQIFEGYYPGSLRNGGNSICFTNRNFDLLG